MSTPSSPYQSRFVRAVLRQTRRWIDRGQTTARRVQIAASWSAQILLYPIYALFQTGRLLGKTIGQAAQPAAVPTLESHEISLQATAAELTAETPIQNLLQEISTLAIATDVAVLVQSPPAIRAIACLLNQTLVLVTNHNQILDILTPEQQQALQQRIVWELASYYCQRRTWNLPQQRVVRFLQQARSRLFPFQSADSVKLLQSVPSPDLAVQQSLLTVQQLLAVSATAAPALARSLQPTPIPAVHIRGVASAIATRSLVLVTNQNRTLDILTPEQQQLLQQRLVWEVAHYWRYLRLRDLRLRESATALAPLRLPSDDRTILPPVRMFQRLMTWMQFGSVARSANLFRETGLLTAAPTIPPDSPSAPVYFRRSAQLRQLQPAEAVVPSTRHAASPIGHRTLARSRHQPAAALAVAAMHPGSITTASVTPHSDIAQLPSHSGKSSLGYIDTDVTLVGYEPNWFERSMRWLDRCLVWLEGTIEFIWNVLFKKIR